MKRRSFLGLLFATPFAGSKDSGKWIGHGVSVPAENLVDLDKSNGEHVDLPQMDCGTGGTFTLTYNGKTSRAIPFDASLYEIDAEVMMLGLPIGYVTTPEGRGETTIRFDKTTEGERQ